MLRIWWSTSTSRANRSWQLTITTLVTAFITHFLCFCSSLSLTSFTCLESADFNVDAVACAIIKKNQIKLYAHKISGKHKCLPHDAMNEWNCAIHRWVRVNSRISMHLPVFDLLLQSRLPLPLFYAEMNSFALTVSSAARIEWMNECRTTTTASQFNIPLAFKHFLILLAIYSLESHEILKVVSNIQNDTRSFWAITSNFHRARNEKVKHWRKFIKRNKKLIKSIDGIE